MSGLSGWPRRIIAHDCIITKLSLRRTHKWKVQKQRKKLNKRRKELRTYRNTYKTSLKTVYCVRVAVGIMENVSHTNNCLLNADTQLDLVTSRFLPASWMEEVRNKHSCNLCSATNDLIVILAQIELYVRLLNLRGMNISIVIDTMSINNLIGNYFMDKFGTGIHPMERMINSLRSRSITIHSTNLQKSWPSLRHRRSKEKSVVTLTSFGNKK